MDDTSRNRGYSDIPPSGWNMAITIIVVVIITVLALWVSN